MTKELLLARRTDLEGKLAEQRSIQAGAQYEIGRLQQKVARSRDEENAIGGAIQDVNYWGQLLDKEERAAAELARKQGQEPAPDPPKLPQEG
jgi:hypothetical protein